MRFQKHILVIALILTIVFCFAACGTDATSAPNCVHTDQDDNGQCDSCTGSVLVYLDIYAINDLHGKLSDGESHPGVDELTTFLRTMQKKKTPCCFLWEICGRAARSPI